MYAIKQKRKDGREAYLSEVVVIPANVDRYRTPMLKIKNRILAKGEFLDQCFNEILCFEEKEECYLFYTALAYVDLNVYEYDVVRVE